MNTGEALHRSRQPADAEMHDHEPADVAALLEQDQEDHPECAESGKGEVPDRGVVEENLERLAHVEFGRTRPTGRR